MWFGEARRRGTCANVWRGVQEMETGQLSDSHEKWRDLYTMEDLPYGGNWKRAEALDPAEDRLWPSGEPPEWVPTHRH